MTVDLTLLLTKLSYLSAASGDSNTLSVAWFRNPSSGLTLFGPSDKFYSFTGGILRSRSEWLV